jgi:hypothetical protein
MEVYVAGVPRRLASATSAAPMASTASKVAVPQMSQIYMVKITVFALTIFLTGASRETNIVTKVMSF